MFGIWLAGVGYVFWYLWVVLVFQLCLLPIVLWFKANELWFDNSAIGFWSGVTLAVIYGPYALGIAGAIAQHGTKAETFLATLRRVYGVGSPGLSTESQDSAKS